MLRYAILLLLLIFVTTSEQGAVAQQIEIQAAARTTTAAPAHETFLPLRDPATPRIFELPAEALHLWKKYKKDRPVLVLFSIHPFLDPIPESMKTEVATLLQNGSAEDFYQRGSLSRSNPALSSLQTLSAALEAGLFSRVVWFFPTREELAGFSSEKLQTRMKEAGFMTENEAESMTLQEEGVIGGTLRGVPLQVVHPLAALPEIKTPVLLHLDLGYFKGLYKNGVSTPAYDLLQDVAVMLRDTNYATLDASLSYSTEGGEFSLETRFLIDALSSLLKNPAMLSGEMPESWRLRKDALYKREMFMESGARDIVATAAQKFPQDASVLYDEFQAQLQTGQSETAFALLDKIVALSPGYAEEYLALAGTAADKGWDDKTIYFLDKAEKYIAVNPFISLFKIDTLIRLKRFKETLPLIAALKKRDWSPHFYPKMQERLTELEQFVANPQPTAETIK